MLGLRRHSTFLTALEAPTVAGHDCLHSLQEIDPPTWPVTKPGRAVLGSLHLAAMLRLSCYDLAGRQGVPNDMTASCSFHPKSSRCLILRFKIGNAQMQE